MFQMPVSQYMTRSPVTIQPTATLEHAREMLGHTHSSALIVRDAAGRGAGVISRSDLLRAGPGSDAQVQTAMGTGIVSISPDTSVAEAARLMVDKHIHRVFVEEDHRLVGVFSTRDVMDAIVQIELSLPLSSVMTRSVITVSVDDPVSAAVDELTRNEVTGLAVLEGGNPVGTFTQEDALAARDKPSDTRVGKAMGYWFLVLPVSTPMHYAAARAATLDVRHILVRDDGSLAATERPIATDTTLPMFQSQGDRLVGMVTGIDMAGAALLG